VSGTPALDAERLLAPRLEQRILPGLERMERALDALGHPERAFTSVLILGTNGKGSTAALLAGILGAHGLAVGLYTSPHLVAIEERIRVGGAKVRPERLAALVARLGRFPELSFFETLTCAAVLEFAERRVEVAVMEAGLGGRWDASAAAAPAVALLTNVGTDHQRWLGSTRAEIAAEKAAALSGREAIVGAWDDEVEGVIRASARPGTPISLASEWARVRGLRAPGSGLRKTVQGAAGLSDPSAASCRQRVAFQVGAIAGEAELPLAGDHQLGNLALALAGAAALAKHRLAPALEAGAARRGIEGVGWPGRLQWLEAHGRRLLVDGAHNLEAMRAVAAALDAMGLSGRVHLLFSCLDDKPLEAMAALLRPRVTGVTVVPIASPRATPVAALAAAFPGCRVASAAAAALPELPADRPTLVTGSLRLAGEVLAAAGGDHG
jgi:dihydrofolate synthase / folylpolyglutamate synthase